MIKILSKNSVQVPLSPSRVFFIRRPKSRRDGILLTAGFSLRTASPPTPAVPQGRRLKLTIFDCCDRLVTQAKARGFKVSSLRDCPYGALSVSVRRLKPPVNKVSSLRDFGMRHRTTLRGQRGFPVPVRKIDPLTNHQQSTIRNKIINK